MVKNLYHETGGEIHIDIGFDIPVGSGTAQKLAQVSYMLFLVFDRVFLEKVGVVLEKLLAENVVYPENVVLRATGLAYGRHNLRRVLLIIEHRLYGVVQRLGEQQQTLLYQNLLAGIVLVQGAFRHTQLLGNGVHLHFFYTVAYKEVGSLLGDFPFQYVVVFDHFLRFLGSAKIQRKLETTK